MDGLLLHLSSSQFAVWIWQSTWVYPILLALHATGLALLTGIAFVLGLSILGNGHSLPIAGMRRFGGVMWLGFALNAITGCMLFVGDAVKYYYSTAFRLKLISVLVGTVLTWMISAGLSRSARWPVQSDTSGNYRALVAGSLLCWFGAIVAGRLLAYTS